MSNDNNDNIMTETGTEIETETETGTEMLNARISALQAQNTGAGGAGDPDEYHYPYVIFQLFENKFAINCKYVVSIEQASPTTELVNASNEFRGISYYKNEPMSVFDLRRIFGLMSSEEYIRAVADLPRRISEHEAYARELLAGAESDNLSGLETDPNKCEFGKWFAQYKTKVLSIEVRKEMDKIEPLHEKFHNAAKTIKGLAAAGKPDEAAAHLAEFEIIKAALTEEMAGLNEALLQNVAELNIILQLNGKKIGLVVDAAESVEEIDDIQELPPSVVMTDYIKRLGLSKKDKHIIFIIEAGEFSAKLENN